MLAAAVETILEEGYYRASSNRIAQRAGVTWGVIQYHFGTRELLLLAVAHNGAEDLLTRLRTAEIHGDTIEARLESLADVIWAHYRRPQFLAYVQVLLNLSKDPRTSADTVESLAESERVVGGLWQDLIDQVIPAEQQRPRLGSVIFELIRGLAIGQSLMEALPHGTPRRADDEARHALVQALAAYLNR